MENIKPTPVIEGEKPNGHEPEKRAEDPCLKSRGPWSVEPGPDSLFEVTTRLMGEREIDVQDRGAKIRLTIKMMPQEKKNIVLKDVKAILHLPDKTSFKKDGFYKSRAAEAYQQISIGVMGGNNEFPALYASEGELVVYEMPVDEGLLEGGQLEKILHVRTGVFSKDALENSAAALAGLKEFWLEIRYRAVEIGAPEETSLDMYFEVAKD